MEAHIYSDALMPTQGTQQALNSMKELNAHVMRITLSTQGKKIVCHWVWAC
jgi:hypothetical protein